MVDQKGKRHYELLLSITVISLASLVFFIWVEQLAIEVERSRIQYTLSNIRSAIKIHELAALVSSSDIELSRQHEGNPIKLMGKPPPEYVGELSHVGGVKKGSWYFDYNNKEFVYLAKSVNSTHQKTERLRYKLQFTHTLERKPGRLRLVEQPYKAEDLEYE